MRRLTLAAALAVLVATAGLYRHVQAETAAVCPQIPSLLAAYDYTMKTWPNAPVSNETFNDLQYFVGLVRYDQGACGVNANPSPLGQVTLMWHYGNASELLKAYQAAAQGNPVAPTATFAPQPSPTATKIVAPTSTPTEEPTETPIPTATLFVPSIPTGTAQVATATAAVATATSRAATAVVQTATVQAMKAQCTPTIESQMTNVFAGYKQGNVYTLANGQQWVQADTKTSSSSVLFPKVQITFDFGAGCYLKAEGQTNSTRVIPFEVYGSFTATPTVDPARVSTPTSTPSPSFSGTVADCTPAISDYIEKFSGFAQGRTYSLRDSGQVWQQVNAEQGSPTNTTSTYITINGESGKCLLTTNFLPGKSAEVKRIK